MTLLLEHRASTPPTLHRTAADDRRQVSAVLLLGTVTLPAPGAPTIPDIDDGLIAAVEEAFEDAECDGPLVVPCHLPAVAILICLPCGHRGQFCQTHHRQIATNHAWRVYMHRIPLCGDCDRPVPEIRWEPRP